MHFATFCFACTESLFPRLAISKLSWSSWFLAFSSKIFVGLYAVSFVAFSHFQCYTFHSSNSLSQPLESSGFHNYNDTIVHIVHIGFLKFRFLPQSVYKSYGVLHFRKIGRGFHSTPPIISKTGKIIEISTFNRKQSPVVPLAWPRTSTSRRKNPPAQVPTVAR